MGSGDLHTYMSRKNVLKCPIISGGTSPADFSTAGDRSLPPLTHPGALNNTPSGEGISKIWLFFHPFIHIGLYCTYLAFPRHVPGGPPQMLTGVCQAASFED